MAARQLETTFYSAFHSVTVSGIFVTGAPRLGNCYLEIPIKDNVFEIPVMAINSFIDYTLTDSDNADAISISLCSSNIKAKYATPDRNMRDILVADWAKNHLVYIPVSNKGDVINYYGSHGILLTEDFKILLMMSWRIKRLLDTNEDGSSVVKYQFIKPILRIDPVCFSGNDPMLKWCSNKLLKTGLVDKVWPPYKDVMHRTFKVEDLQEVCPSIIIEESPFNIRIPDVPDVLTTREDIIQPVIDHIDELVQ